MLHPLIMMIDILILMLVVKVIKKHGIIGGLAKSFVVLMTLAAVGFIATHT